MANNKVQLANGTVLIDLSDTTTLAGDVQKGKIFYTADGERTEGTKEGSGSGQPSVVLLGETDENGGKVLHIIGAVNESVTQDAAGGSIDALTADVLLDLSDDTIRADVLKAGYTAHDSMGRPVAGTLVPSGEEATLGTKEITANGTYSAADVPSSGGMNIQLDGSTHSVASSSYTATGLTLTVAETGTYNVYWVGWRSTSSGTSGSQLYINGSAYGSANTSFTGTYGQSVKLTSVSLSAGDVLTVRARARNSSYYMYVANLLIEQTS